MPRCTNKWSTPNKRNRHSGRTGSISITKHAQTDSMKCMRSDNSKNRSPSADTLQTPEPEETPDLKPASSLLSLLILSLLLKLLDAAIIPMFCAPSCGGNGSAECDLFWQMSDLGKIVVVVYMLFSIEIEVLLPRCLSSLLGVLHLFVHSGIVTDLTSLCVHCDWFVSFCFKPFLCLPPNAKCPKSLCD
jgi:hypothetical protein